MRLMYTILLGLVVASCFVFLRDIINNIVSDKIKNKHNNISKMTNKCSI